MKKFIFDSRNGIYIIDLSKTLVQLEAACDVLASVVSRGGKVLLVGTKKQAQEAVKEAAQACGQFYVTERWLGGTLTNLKTIRRSINRLKEIEKMEADGSLSHYGKQEQSALRREAARLHKNLDGIRGMEQLPEALFVIDIKREHNAVAEAQRLNIPLAAIVDTNCDPDLVSYPIPGNDDAIRSIRMVLTTVVQAIIQARADYEAKYGRRKTEEPPPATPAPAEAAPVAPVAPVAATPEELASLAAPAALATPAPVAAPAV